MADDPLIPVPIPALGALLIALEKQKGARLTEREVLAARDKAVCVALPLSKKLALDEKRGYADLNPEHVWEEWLRLRAELQSSGDPTQSDENVSLAAGEYEDH